MNILEFDLLEKCDLTIRNSFSAFLKKPSNYKNNYLQSNYNNAFDGYSYMGQKDSLNQYDTDMLHSFVLSEFHNIEDFPQEFHSFLTDEWPQLKAKVREMELKIIQKSSIPFKQLYKDDTIGYMMSCNYYPKPNACAIKAKNNLRLSVHPDVSLLTTFPYGISKGLSYFNNEKQFEIGEKEKTIAFFGYFADFFSNGKIEALKHQVELPKDLYSERYSFAIFSIPKPNSIVRIGNRTINANDYYTKYLSIF
ncbi:MAG: 2OG-Fe(II) oxygenase family protein [Polaribacter sp.]